MNASPEEFSSMTAGPNTSQASSSRGDWSLDESGNRPWKVTSHFLRHSSRVAQQKAAERRAKKRRRRGKKKEARRVESESATTSGEKKEGGRAANEHK